MYNDEFVHIIIVYNQQTGQKLKYFYTLRSSLMALSNPYHLFHPPVKVTTVLTFITTD